MSCLYRGVYVFVLPREKVLVSAEGVKALVGCVSKKNAPCGLRILWCR